MCFKISSLIRDSHTRAVRRQSGPSGAWIPDLNCILVHQLVFLPVALKKSLALIILRKRICMNKVFSNLQSANSETHDTSRYGEVVLV